MSGVTKSTGPRLLRWAHAIKIGFSFRPTIFLVPFILFPLLVHAESIKVGDVEINPGDFSANLDSEQRIVKCLSCHGNQAGGDIDFGPDVHFGTPALRGMQEKYLKESLIAYKTSTRMNKEMNVISSILDEETMNFMARSFAAYKASPFRSASELTALAEEDSVFQKGQIITLRGIPEQGVPACMACHGQLGEGSTVGPRLAGQNSIYIENQFKAFASGTRKTIQSTVMQPVVAGLTEDDVKAVAHYYKSVVETPAVARRVLEAN